MITEVEEAKHNEQIQISMKKEHELGLNPRPLAWVSSNLSITPQRPADNRGKRNQLETEEIVKCNKEEFFSLHRIMWFEMQLFLML